MPGELKFDSHMPEILVVGEIENTCLCLRRLLPVISFQGLNCQLLLGIKVLVLGKTAFCFRRRLCLSFQIWIIHLLLNSFLACFIALDIVAYPAWGNFYQTFTENKYWVNTYVRLWSYISYTCVLTSSLTMPSQYLNSDFKSEYLKTWEQSNSL